METTLDFGLSVLAVAWHNGLVSKAHFAGRGGSYMGRRRLGADKREGTNPLTTVGLNRESQPGLASGSRAVYSLCAFRLGEPSARVARPFGA